jgi:FXSXX-COOH protein
VDAPDRSAVEDPSWAPLIDVSRLRLAAMDTTADSTLARAMRRVLASLDDPNGIISAFESFASSE